ncbi:MAG: hypothetical protein WD187_04020 [Candidatus Woykebacteria bacterium]
MFDEPRQGSIVGKVLNVLLDHIDEFVTEDHILTEASLWEEHLHPNFQRQRVVAAMTTLRGRYRWKIDTKRSGEYPSEGNTAYRLPTQ